MPIPIEEREAQVRSITRTCKGPCILSAKEQQELRDLWYVVQDSGNMPAAMAMIEGLEFAMKTGHLDIKEPNWDLLFRRCADLIYLHKHNCNYDFNNIILANPLDGGDYIVACPNCGVEISYKAPNFTEV